jgi:hypothetical protein
MQWPKLVIATIALGMGLAAGIYAITAGEPKSAPRKTQPAALPSADNLHTVSRGVELKR